ncbi:MAG: FAD-binding protein [Sedimentisphaeraceae bacterium JB056]
MSNYIVLLKQVPDISQITDNVFNPETGTLIRSKLSNVINELDAEALGFVNHMQTISDQKDSKVVTISMGPPSAEEVLRYSLARLADTAILLSDRKLGGADTWATANPLSFAIRKIAKEIFNGDDDFYIVSGMQSVDGDTAQVPPQIASELNVPCVAYATEAHYQNGRFEFTRIISGGSQVVAVKSKPAVITVAKYEYPLFSTLEATRISDKTEVIHWTADDIEATGIGVSGSKTQVIQVFPPGKTQRKCRQIKDVKEFADIIIKSSKADEQESEEQAASGYILPKNRKSLLQRDFESTDKENEHYKILTDKLNELGIDKTDDLTDEKKKKVVDALSDLFHGKTLNDMIDGLESTKPFYNGDVWVIAETHKNEIHSSTFELLGKARQLADSLEKNVGVVVMGNNVEGFSDELIYAGADTVYIIDNPLLSEFEPNCFKKVLSAIIEDYRPQIALYSATPRGRVLAPMTAYGLNCGLTADCTSLEIGDVSRKNEIAILMQTRPALGGNIMATIYTKNSTTQMVTVRPGVMKRIADDPGRKGEIVRFKINLSESDRAAEIIRTEESCGGANFESELIVCGGKGLQSQDNYENITQKLTDIMRDKLHLSAEKGATRAAVEQGFIDRPYQIGQTGTSIGPKIYLGLGVSGAIQHMIGIANTKTIFAVNNDPEAPVFKQCDYYMIDSVENVVPKLIEAFKSI